MIGIYKITSPSGKSYIGQSVNVQFRKWCYQNLKCSDQPKIYNSLIKYGFENHLFEVIVECQQSELNQLEEYYIKHFDTVLNGLNCQFGGGSNLHSEETKAKMSRVHMGNKYGVGNQNTKGMQLRLGAKHTDQTKAKISDKAKGNTRWLGKSHTESTKEKTKISHLFQSKGVICIETGKEYLSIRDCCRQLKIDRSSVNKYLRNQQYKVKGLSFAWKQ